MDPIVRPPARPVKPQCTLAMGIPLCYGYVMPTPNYAFAKRQRDLAKKKKKEEKAERKARLREHPEPDIVDPNAPQPPPEEKPAV